MPQAAKTQKVSVTNVSGAPRVFRDGLGRQVSLGTGQSKDCELTEVQVDKFTNSHGRLEEKDGDVEFIPVYLLSEPGKAPPRAEAAPRRKREKSAE